MTVHWPDSWIIREVLNDKISIRLNDLHVTPLGVEDVFHIAIPGPHTLSQNVKVVAVQVHRVCNWSGVVNEDADGGIGSKIVDVPLWVVRVRDVASIGEKKDWPVVVPTERLTVHGPDEVASGVWPERDVDLLSEGWVGRGGKRKEWCGQREIVIATIRLGVWLSGARGDFIGVRFVVVDGSERIGLIGQTASS